MADMTNVQGIKSITFEGIVTRADGTVEDLGVISYWHKNPLKRLSYKIKRGLNG